MSFRKGPLEAGTLAVLQGQLLTDEHIRLFVEEFKRESDRLARADDRQDNAAEIRLRHVEVEIDNLTRNFLAGVVSPTLATMLGERDAEKAMLQTRLLSTPHAAISASWPKP